MSTILIVDDDQKVLDITLRFFKAAGHNVITAISGHNALEHLQSEKLQFDLVIIDFNIKIITGRDVINECLGKAIPFILTSSGIEGEESIRYIHNIGYSFSDLFHKPIDLYKLNNAVLKKLNPV